MINSFVFILSFGMCYVQILLAYKVERKSSFIQSIILCFMTQVCLGAIGAQILSVLHIYINLVSMSIIYIIIGLGMFVFSIRKRKIQKFLFDRVEILSFFIICIGVGIVFLRVFTPDILLAYQNSDPAAHFEYAMKVVRTGRLSTMYFASLYNALIIEIGQPFVATINCYKLFILADTTANLLNAFMFYCVAEKICESRFAKLCLPFLTLLYFMGWPFFNYAIGGFVYFGWGVTIIMYVIYMLIELEESAEKRHRIILWALIVIGCFCTLICYMLFVPTLGVIVLCSFIRTVKAKGIRTDKRKIVIAIVGILTMVGITFLVAFYGFFGGDFKLLLHDLQVDGWIQNEPYKDFIYLLPVVIFMSINSHKSRKKHILYVAIAIVCGYITVTFIGCLCGIISSYYYYKEYYVLWFLSWLSCADGIDYMYRKDKVLLYVYMGVAVLISTITLLGIDTNSVLRERNLIPDKVMGGENPAALSIYGRANLFITQNREDELKDKEAFFDMCQYLNTNDNEDVPIMITSSNYMGKWFTAVTEGQRIWVYTREDFARAIDEIQKKKITRIIIHQNTENYRENVDLINTLECIYDNGYYGVYMIH